jgi:hypothetical protein
MTHPSSPLTGIDLFASGSDVFQPEEVFPSPENFKQCYFQNIYSSKREQRISTQVGYLFYIKNSIFRLCNQDTDNRMYIRF